MCPPASPHEGASIRKCTNMFWCEHASFMNGNGSFTAWDVPFADGNAAARTFGRAHRHRPYGFVWADCAWTVDAVLGIAHRPVDFVWVDCVCGFVCWENGAHEPTPSVLYFCQPRVADDRRLPWGKSWRGTYAIGIVLFKINLHAGDHSFAACGNDVR